MVTGQYPPDINGAALQCKSIVDSLKHKIEFHVVTSPTNYPIFLEDRAHVHRILLLNSIVSVARSLLKFVLLVFTYQFELVHFHGYSKKTLPLAILSKLSGAKTALKFTSFGIDDFVTLRNKGIIHSRGLGLFDVFYCPAPAFLPKENEVGNSLILSKFVRLNNGVDANTFSPVSFSRRVELRQELGVAVDSFVIVSIAHFSDDKGLADILEALDRLANLTRNITILMVGSRDVSNYEVSSSLVKRFEAAQKPLKLSGVDLRFIDRTYEVWKYLQICDSYVLSSRREGSPNALLQAMACGVPCIATRLPGITDDLITDGVNGLFYEAGNSSELVRLINFILLNDEFAFRLGEHARRKVLDSFKLERTSCELFQSYKSVLKSN